MKEANGGLVLSYANVPSMIHEIIGRTTACPCSGWWSTKVAGNRFKHIKQSLYSYKKIFSNENLKVSSIIEKANMGKHKYPEHHQKDAFPLMDNGYGSTVKRTYISIWVRKICYKHSIPKVSTKLAFLSS